MGKYISHDHQLLTDMYFSFMALTMLMNMNKLLVVHLARPQSYVLYVFLVALIAFRENFTNGPCGLTILQIRSPDFENRKFHPNICERVAHLVDTVNCGYFVMEK